MLEEFTTGSGIIDAIVATPLVLFIAWITKTTISRTQYFLKQLSIMALTSIENNNEKLSIASNKARYRDLFVMRSIIYFLGNFFYGILIVFIFSEVNEIGFTEAAPSIITYFFKTVSTLMILSGFFLIGSSFRIIQQADHVLAYWMKQLEEKNG